MVNPDGVAARNRSGGPSPRLPRAALARAAAILLTIALLLAVVAPLIGRMVHLAMSRSRESLADDAEERHRQGLTGQFGQDPTVLP